MTFKAVLKHVIIRFLLLYITITKCNYTFRTDTLINCTEHNLPNRIKQNFQRIN